jgi:hypothetical protein
MQLAFQTPCLVTNTWYYYEKSSCRSEMFMVVSISPLDSTDGASGKHYMSSHICPPFFWIDANALGVDG